MIHWEKVTIWSDRWLIAHAFNSEKSKGAPTYWAHESQTDNVCRLLKTFLSIRQEEKFSISPLYLFQVQKDMEFLKCKCLHAWPNVMSVDRDYSREIIVIQHHYDNISLTELLMVWSFLIVKIVMFYHSCCRIWGSVCLRSFRMNETKTKE